MFDSTMINEKLFKILVDCVKSKGIVISDRFISKSGLYVLTIKGEVYRYINIFEAFHNIYETYNCRLQMDSLLKKLKGSEYSKNDLLNKENFLSIEKDNREQYDYIINYLYRNSILIKLGDWDRKNIESKISSMKISDYAKGMFISKIIAEINRIYHNEISVLNQTERELYKKKFHIVNAYFTNLKDHYLN